MRTRVRSFRTYAVLLAAFAFVLGLPGVSQGASKTVVIRDNVFSPREVRIDPGDTVIWHNQGTQRHDVRSDKRGEFRSGDLQRNDTYRHTFNEEGYYYYHCTYHGSRGKVGMWGVVIVGNPPPPPDEQGGEKDRRPKLVVPKDFKTIQKAVDHAKPGSTIVIRPGTYKENVVVQTSDLVIRGFDRFRTVLHGRDKAGNGIVFDGVKDVAVKNLTVRNYRSNGIFFNNTKGYLATRIDSIKNRTYGIYAFDSYDGVIKNSWGYGSGDSAFYIGQCMACGGLIENVTSKTNYLGYSGTNATGVIIRRSRFVHNGAGIVPNTLPTEDLGPNRGTYMINNVVKNNNYENIPAAGFSDSVGIPFGTGIWMAGTENNVARNNHVVGNHKYGILVTPSIDPNSVPHNNRVYRNFVRGAEYDLAWDGNGTNNCFSKNDFETSGPPDIETLYGCPNRPFVGIIFAPVEADVAAATTNVATREQKEPPEPKRPRCQKGKPGCNR